MGARVRLQNFTLHCGANGDGSDRIQRRCEGPGLVSITYFIFRKYRSGRLQGDLVPQAFDATHCSADCLLLAPLIKVVDA